MPLGTVWMVMTEIRLPEARDLFSRELTFPVSRSRVVETTGEVVLRSPTGTAEPIGDVMERCADEEFESIDELYSALISFLGEEYVGRKGYDDRGTTFLNEGEEVLVLTMDVTIVTGVPGVGTSHVSREARRSLEDGYELLNFGDIMLEQAVAQGLVTDRDDLASLSRRDIRLLQRRSGEFVATRARGNRSS
ncbi:MAG: AAA family ATPase [Natrialbaceae archaeon]|nr:AAA family ATPase [Natrialbaceae archaeon]